MTERAEHVRAPAPREIALLTPMRGFAALTVVLYHADFSVFGRGYLAVDLFFLLSGFVLMHAYGRWFNNEVRPGVAGIFLWRRLARIYPTHAVTTLLLAPHLGAGPGYSPMDLAICLSLGQVLLPYPAFNDIAWSVSAEWFVYLGFPFLSLAVGRTSLRVGLGAAAILAALWWALSLGENYGIGPDRMGWEILVGRAFPEFVVGMLLYRCYTARWWSHIWRRDTALIAVAIVLGAFFLIDAPDGVIVALLAPLLLAAANNAGQTARWLSGGVPQWFGDASYSIYLAQTPVMAMSHVLMQSSLGPFVGRSALQVGFIISSLTVGALLYRCVDQPFRTYLRTLGPKRIDLPASLAMVSVRSGPKGG
jgi:peptidoglycan/LPS O-acetylase OafA/YrhL